MAVDPQDALRRRLIEVVLTSPWFLPALGCVRQLGLDDWCIGAGAVRNLVWDALCGRTVPSPLADIDVAYFDEADTSSSRDRRLTERLMRIEPQLPWEVTNQAGVHRWFERHFGHPVAPLRSLAEAVSTWPEFATSVGVTMRRDGTIDVLAPHGLDDLFGMVIRRNPARVSLETYRARTVAKRYVERWPGVTVIAC